MYYGQIHDYVEMIVSSSAKRKFCVHVVSTEDILDFKSWWPTMYKRNALSVESVLRSIPRDKKISFNIASFHHFQYTSDVFSTVRTSCMINGLHFHTFKLGRPNVLQSSLAFPSMQAYPQSYIPINARKMEDITKSANYIVAYKRKVYCPSGRKSYMANHYSK